MRRNGQRDRVTFTSINLGDRLVRAAAEAFPVKLNKAAPASAVAKKLRLLKERSDSRDGWFTVEFLSGREWVLRAVSNFHPGLAAWLLMKYLRQTLWPIATRSCVRLHRSRR